MDRRYTKNNPGLLLLFLLLFFSSSSTLAYDIVNNTSVTVWATVPDTSVPPVTPPSGGGGGGAFVPQQTTVIFSGRAYPLSQVTILKDSQVALSTISGPDANFSATLSGLSAGNYIFSVYGEDNNGQRSTLFTFPVSITAGATTNISGIFITPTIDVDKIQVKKGDNLAIFGRTFPQGEVIIQVNSQQEVYGKTVADKDGAYLYSLDTDSLDAGQHTTKSKVAISGAISSFSKSVAFAVGDKNIEKKNEESLATKTDINGDSRVNLKDFSVMAYWFKRPAPPSQVDLNEDGVVDLRDFSILAYYWTG